MGTNNPKGDQVQGAILKVFLHGHLKHLFGGDEYIDISVDNFTQLYAALRSIYPDFHQQFKSAQQYAFLVRAGDDYKYISANELLFPLDATEIHIIPDLDGSGVEYAAVASWLATYGVTSAVVVTVAYIAVNVAVAVVIGAVVSMLAPKPKTGISSSAGSTPSFYFSGAVNVVDPGYPVPLVYGEVLTGSVVLSTSIKVEDIPVLIETTPEV